MSILKDLDRQNKDKKENDDLIKVEKELFCVKKELRHLCDVLKIEKIKNEIKSDE